MGKPTSGARGGASASASVGTSSRAMPASSTGGLNVIRSLSLVAPRSSTVASREEALASILDLAGTHLNEAQLDELIDSKEDQKNTSDASKRLQMANPLGLVNDNTSLHQRHNNKTDNTLCGQLIWD